MERRSVTPLRIGTGAVALALLAALAGCGNERPAAEATRAAHAASVVDPTAARRGKYLVDAANCAGCHTDTKHGGARLAGGKAIDTPFGAYLSRNITPDPTYGIGAWSDADFLHALRQGLSPSGAHYFPAFPFPSFTNMTDRDILDIKAYLMTQAPVAQPDKPHDVPFPFDVRAIMVLWRALYFTPGPLAPDPTESAEWNRGAYLVTAVSHCGECHTPRNFLGALESDRRFAGARLAGPDAKRAPNITPEPHDGIGGWSVDDIATLLKTGMTPEGDFVAAPMSEVVDAGTAKLTESDRRAIAVYLKSLPAQAGKGG
ncbi:MAG TPA: cytochrome c [Stellaceae bacterium]